jgi:flagellar motor switch protein FliN/FliY
MSAETPAGGFLELELPVEVWLGSEAVPLKRLLDLEPGGVLPLTHDPDGPVDLVVNGAVVASGELVVVDGRFGFRVTETSRRKLAELNVDPQGGTEAP